MGHAQAKYDTYYTFEEYLKLESELEEKYEYHNGQLVAMTGGSLNHGIIGNNVGTAIQNELRKKGSNCLVTNNII